MTRKSKRELERAIEALDCSAGGLFHDGIAVAFRDPETGELYDRPPSDEGANEVDEEEANPFVIVTDHIVETEWEAEQ